MKVDLYKKCLAVSVLLLVSSLISNVHAQWQKVKFLDAAYAGFVTKSGNLIISDYLFEGGGGIYLSEDGGETWNKTDVEDHSYNKFFVSGDYIFGIGSNAVIARSADEGKTWDTVSYRDAALEVLDAQTVDFTVAYAITEHKGKLFIGDFNGAGIMYSEDNGETWKRTDIESLKYNVVDEGETYSYVENIYQLVSFNEKLYAFGVYFVFEYDEAENKWKMLRDDSNFMSVSTIMNGTLYCGRSCPNDVADDPFIEMTTDFSNWTINKGPKEIATKNVRVLYNDGKNVFAATQDRGVFMLDVENEKWYNISEGYPEMYPGDEYLKGIYHAPTQLFSDDEYLYAIVYDFPGAPGEAAGLYRLSKKELDKYTDISSVRSDAEYYIDGSYIVFPGNEASAVRIYNASGSLAVQSAEGSRVYIGSLQKGIYILEAEINGSKTIAKFVI